MSYGLKADAGAGPETMALLMKFAVVPNGKASWTQRRSKIAFWKGWAGRNVRARSGVCTAPPKVSMKVETEKEEQSGNTGATNVALERTNPAGRVLVAGTGSYPRRRAGTAESCPSPGSARPQA